MSTEQDAATPAAAVLERRQRRTTPQKRKQVCSDSDSEESETGSDGEWSGDDDPLSDHGREDEDEDEPVLRGRVRRHAITQAVTGPELDDGRHKSLVEKGWARRAVVVRGVGPCGGADLEELPGREEYGGDEEGFFGEGGFLGSDYDSDDNSTAAQVHRFFAKVEGLGIGDNVLYADPWA